LIIIRWWFTNLF